MDIPFGKIPLKPNLPVGQFGRLNNKIPVDSYFGSQLIEDTSHREMKPDGKDDQGYRHDK
jgi:hypothetical protein